MHISVLVITGPVCYPMAMPSPKVIGITVSLLVHSVAGVAYWDWCLCRQNSGDSRELNAISLVVVPERDPSRVSPAVKAPESVLPATVPATPLPPRPSMEQLTAVPVSLRMRANETVQTPQPSGALDKTVDESTEFASIPTVIDASENDVKQDPGKTEVSNARSDVHANSGGSSDFTRAVIRRNPPPEYPRLALAHGHEGTVLLSVRIAADGKPASVEVRESSGHAELDQAATAAVRSWDFEPAHAGRLAIDSIVEVPVSFRITATRSGPAVP